MILSIENEIFEKNSALDKYFTIKIIRSWFYDKNRLKSIELQKYIWQGFYNKIKWKQFCYKNAL